MKIIKRIVAENTATDKRTSQPLPKSHEEDRRGMVNVVKGWISERADNRQIEKIAAMHGLLKLKTAGS